MSAPTTSAAEPTAEPTAGPGTVPLSLAMRTGSREAHERAEGSAFVGALLDGRVAREGYAAYLERLWGVYTVLEAQVRRRVQHPAVAAVRDPALERLAALELDLEHWSPATLHRLRRTGRVGSRAVRTYRRRLEHAADHPHLLVAHHYTRYLGDLAGGQAIGRAVQAAYGGSTGRAFYDFPAIEKPTPYRRDYRNRVDAVPLTARERAEVVAEVVVAFELNRALLDELAPAAG